MIIVTYNSEPHIRSCLAGLRQAPPLGRVKIVDNASTDGTAMVVAREYPWVELIENDQNTGFAAAVNLALELPASRPVLLLNPDAVITWESVLRLLEILEADPAIGIVAPMITQPEGTLRVLSAGYFPSISAVAAHYWGLTRITSIRGFNLLATRDAKGPKDVDWVSGACMMISQQALNRVGKISERWFMYAEDIEFCRRVQNSGLRVVHHPGVTVTHLLGASAAAGSRVSLLWIDSLFDLYCMTTQSAVRRIVWRFVVSTGLMTRALVLWAAWLGNRQDRFEVGARRMQSAALRAARPGGIDVSK